jgi:C_GCAxxG_C_C family probable redox protein
MSNADYAVDCYNNGCSCAQAVFTTFCEEYGIDKKLGLKIACPFGGGMGHTGGVCGAVTGALLVLGLKYGQENTENKYSKAMNYLIVQDFISRFKKLNGTINCSELIKYNLGDEQQLNAARQTDIFKTMCPKYVDDAVTLLESIMAEYVVAGNGK